MEPYSFCIYCTLKHITVPCVSCFLFTLNPLYINSFLSPALDQDYSPENRARCSDATKPLLEAVENLCTFANSPEFASVPAKISAKARQAQEPITSAGKAIISGSCSMIESAKSLAVNPKDPPTWQSLATHSKCVSDSIKSLVASIRYWTVYISLLYFTLM